MASRFNSVYRGTKSPEYIVVQGHFYNLVTLFQDSLSQLATQFYSVKLISSTEYDNALGNQPAFDRAASTLRSVQKRIEYETKWYCEFMKAMDQFPYLEDLLKKIESDYQREKETILPEFVPGELRDESRGVYRQRSFSDSSVLMRSKSSGSSNSDKDSAYFEPSSWATAEDNFKDVDSLSVSRKTSRVLDRAQSMCCSGALVLTGSNGVTFEIPPCESETSEENSTWVSDSKAQGHGQAEIVAPTSSIGEGVRSVSGNGSHHYQCQLKISSLEKVKRKLEIDIQFLKKEHKLRESQLLGQKHKVSSKLQEQQVLVKDQDNVIENLKADQATKDTQIKDLRKEKEDLEGRIKVLKKERDEARENKEAAEQRVATYEKEFKEREQDLLNKLETVKKSEGEAVNELYAVKQQLAEAKLEREKERSHYNEKRHELEKKQLILEAELKNQELSHAKELAEKETQLAKTDKELAESKTRCMAMELEAVRREMEALKLQSKT